MAVVVFPPEPVYRTLRELPLHVTVITAKPANPTGSLLPCAAQCDTHTCVHTHSHIHTHRSRRWLYSTKRPANA